MFEDHTLLNKWFLSYKSRHLESLYIEEKKEMQKWLFLLVSTCGCILNVFFSIFNYYEVQNELHMFVSIGFVVLWLTIMIIGIYYPFTVKYLLLIFCIIQTLYTSHSYLEAIDRYVIILEPRDSLVCIFIYGLVYITLIALATHPINSFIIRFFAMNFASIYFCTSLILKQVGSVNLLWIGAVICLVCMDFIYYFEERFSKIQFVEKYKQKKQLEGWKTLLDESFPVGVVIARKFSKESKLNVIFSNQTCHDMFNNQDNAYIEKQLQLIQVENSKSKINGGTDHRMENHIFIGDCTEQKQCLPEQIIQYFHLNRQERKMSIVQSGKPYCSFGYYLNEKQEKSHFNIIANNIAWENESCFLIVLKDVSQKMMYDRLQEIDQYKDQLLASVTHELKTPLNCILSIVQVAEQEEEIVEIRRQLELIRKSGCMLEMILNDILDYSRLQKQKLRLLIKNFDIVQTIDDVINIVQIQFSKPEIQIIKEIQIKDTIILSDSNRLKQIIFNLLTNAIKFTQRGEIRIIVKQSSTSCHSITVQDTGVGIPENLQKQLFKLYGTFDHSNGSNRHGVGLGLVITKNLVALLGPTNHIQLESQEGKGSSFTFEIYHKLNSDDNSMTELTAEEDLGESNNIVSCFDPHSNNNVIANNNSNLNNNHGNGSSCINFNNIVLGFESSPPINNNANGNNKSIHQLITKLDTDVNNLVSEQGSPLKTDQIYNNPDLEKTAFNEQFPQGCISKNLFSQQHIPIEKRSFKYRKFSAQIYHTQSNSNKSVAQHPPQLNCDVKKRYRNSFFVSQPNSTFSTTDQQILFNTPQFQRGQQNSDSSLMFTSLNPFNCDDKQHLNDLFQHHSSQQQFSSPNQSPSPKKCYTNSSLNRQFQTSKSFQEASPPPIQNLLKKNQLSQRCSFDVESTNVPSKSHSDANVFDIIFKTRTKILIVDDTYFNITALRFLLGKSQNLVIEEAFHGLQAIEKIEESQKQNDPFQLVFMDMNMPVMDGVQAIIIIRQKIKDGLLSDLKIAVCSAFGDLSSKMRCLKAGADLHIVKPINKYEMEQQLLQIYNIQLDSHS